MECIARATKRLNYPCVISSLSEFFFLGTSMPVMGISDANLPNKKMTWSKISLSIYLLV